MTVYNIRGEELDLCPADKSKCINITRHWHNLPDDCVKCKQEQSAVKEDLCLR